MRTAVVIVGVIALVGTGPAGYAAGPRPTSCLSASDAAHDEEPPPQAVGFERGSLDVLGLTMRADAKALRVVVRARSLARPVQPPGQNLSYRVFWATRPPEAPEQRFSLDAELDGMTAVFTLGVAPADTRTAATGSVYTQVGGPLAGSVDPARRTVTVDVPRSLLAPYTKGKGRVLREIAFTSWHGIGNPTVSYGGQAVAGSSGYRRIADTNVTSAQLDVSAPRCRP